MLSRLFTKCNLLQFGLSRHQEVVSLLIASSLFQTLFYLSLFFSEGHSPKGCTDLFGLSAASLSPSFLFLQFGEIILLLLCWEAPGIMGSATTFTRLWLSPDVGWFPLLSAIAKQAFFTALFLAWMIKLFGLLCRNTLEDSYLHFFFFVKNVF